VELRASEDQPEVATAPPPRRYSARRRLFRGRLLFESALIMVSVLLALALGEWREHLRERKLARTALTTFRREIESNLARLEQVQPKHAAMARRLGVAASAPSTTGTAFDVFVSQMPPDGLDTQPLREVAWETAQTTGALRLLDYETAVLLSETYLVQRSALFQTLQRLSDRFLAPQNFDPAQRGPMVKTHEMLLVELSGQESYLMEIYRRALARLPRDATIPKAR
jgi:hypothetical protein